jgi:hypothetical protein
MKHNTIYPAARKNSDRPVRDTVIEKDDITSLIIDLNLLSADDFLRKYCLTTSTESPKKVTFPK